MASKKLPPISSRKSRIGQPKITRRRARHDDLVTRIRSGAELQMKRGKSTRRQKQYLQANLSSLVNVLPQLEQMHHYGPSTHTPRAGSPGKTESASARPSMTSSLRSRPRASKHKEKIITAENKRFQQNMAVMSGVPCTVSAQKIPHDEMKSLAPQQEDPPSERHTISHRWAAIRMHVSQALTSQASLEEKSKIGKVPLL